MFLADLFLATSWSFSDSESEHSEGVYRGDDAFAQCAPMAPTLLVCVTQVDCSSATPTSWLAQPSSHLIPCSLARSNVLTILAQHREPGKFQARHQYWRQQDGVGRAEHAEEHTDQFPGPQTRESERPGFGIVDTSIGRDHVYRDGGPGARAARAWAELEVVRGEITQRLRDARAPV